MSGLNAQVKIGIRTFDKIIDLQDLVGVAEIADLLTRHINQMTNLIPGTESIERASISMWHSRRRTSEFPEALPLRLGRGLLWDVNDFIDRETGRLKWLGPPGRWREDA